jgi:hypothetical protein
MPRWLKVLGVLLGIAFLFAALNDKRAGSGTHATGPNSSSVKAACLKFGDAAAGVKKGIVDPAEMRDAFKAAYTIAKDANDPDLVEALEKLLDATNYGSRSFAENEQIFRRVMDVCLRDLGSSQRSADFMR